MPEQEVGVQESGGNSTESTDGTERFEEVMTPIQVNAVGLEPEWSDEDMARLQREDETLSVVICHLEQGTKKPPTSWSRTPGLQSFARVWRQLCLVDGVLHRDRYVTLPGGGKKKSEVLVLPRKLSTEVLRQAHERSGHMGIDRTVARLESKTWWPGYTSDVADWIKCCENCARRKGPAVSPRAPLMNVPVGGPMEMLAMDILGPLPESNSGNRYLLVISDYFTKWPEVFAMKDQKAVSVARVLYNEVVSRFGIPIVLHSDQGQISKGLS